MRLVRGLVALLLLSLAGFMAFDGVRALTVGDYLRPTEGEHAGQLGPWTHAVEAVGLDPMSTVTKSLFVAFGAAGLVVLVGFLRRRPWAWGAALAYAVATSWYLVVGTVHAVLIAALLLLPGVRSSFTGRTARTPRS